MLLRTTEKSGASFIRTDQLDGETDWKLRFVCAFTCLRDNNQFVCRRAVSVMQKLPSDASVFSVWASVYGKIIVCEWPKCMISFFALCSLSYFVFFINIHSFPCLYACKVEKPTKDIYNFVGTFTVHNEDGTVRILLLRSSSAVGSSNTYNSATHSLSYWFGFWGWY